jgi:hypothetical protein
VLWIWIQNLWFGSGTRERPSGYTTHEITIFKYKMGDFCFWPKETMYQQLRFHFDILRFYQDFTFLNFAVWFFIVGDAFQWFGMSHSRPLIPLCCFLMVLLPSCLDLVCQGACHCRTFRKLSWSIFMILSRDKTPLSFKWRREQGSDFAGSDARWVPYPLFHN